MTIMKKNLLSYLSLGTLIIGAALGGYALVNIWILKASVPTGSCPVITHRPFLYAGIALCLASFVFTLLEQHAKKAGEK